MYSAIITPFFSEDYDNEGYDDLAKKKQQQQILLFLLDYLLFKRRTWFGTQIS